MNPGTNPSETKENIVGGQPPPTELGLSDPGQEDRARRGIPIIPVFDGYRAVAIFGIVIFHLFGLAPLPDSWVDPYLRLSNATLGQLIDVLFIVSGFVVFLPTAIRGEFGRIAPYAMRRAARLLPAYYVALLLTAVTLSISPSIETILLHLLGVQTVLAYFPDIGGIGFSILGPVWTLSVEIGFYVVLPFVAMSFYRHPVAGLVIAAAVAIAWTQASLHPEGIASLFGVDLSESATSRLHSAMGLQFPFWAFSFALGMIAAKIFTAVHRGWRADEFKRWSGRAQLLSLAGMVLIGYLIYHDPDSASAYVAAEEVRQSPLISIGFSLSLAVFMLATVYGPRFVQRPFDNSAIRWLAEISYGAYLVHVLLIFIVVWKLGLGPPDDLVSFLVLFASVLAGSVIYGYLSARLLEQPIRRWARRFSRAP